MGTEGARRGLPSLIISSSSSRGQDDGKERIASGITELVGWTPLLELKQIMRKDGIDVRLVGKIESYQPLCSIKDRSALRMIEDAEEKGLITPGITTLVEPTSGNLGIGLAYIAVQKDPKLGFQGASDRVEQLKENIPNVYVLDQLTNAANPEAHYTGTGPEIWTDTAGKVDVFVCGSGSGGTLTGVGRYLKMKKPSVKIICVEPAENAVISGGNPGSHNIQGIGPGFIPQNLDTAYIDEVIAVPTAEAMTHARRLAREEGLLVGISSGANLAACLKVASREENRGKMIVTMFASGGERYMSTELFDSVREECINMTF
ncbi:cysteine synthase, chloroplastic/chromoplastic isoform X4 [Elaeis guineensis]|uniref:Cysteine synthase, chloroplastic/chromoplastic isoform X4 n=1 Tax=Elaeis guineensis var. tenera TaxID=51953 RepID=A0A6I9QW24_ELAGV|nr:cysteine synthase, chloroplastic/chromoplastic isoform X4 [Elaeis guineensis]